MKGRLFYHQNDYSKCESINRDHEKALWMTHSEFKKSNEFQSKQWQILTKKSWISVEDKDAEIYDSKSLLNITQSVYIRSYEPKPVSFILVTDEWLEKVGNLDKQ